MIVLKSGTEVKFLFISEISPEILSNLQIIILNIGEIKKWFPRVGSSFTYFIIKNAPHNNTPTTIITKNSVEQMIIPAGVPCIPLQYNDIIASIFNKVVFNDSPSVGGLKPCANIMYESLNRTGYDEIVCVILTGMGADGTKGILSLNDKKPLYVISQDAQTCVVYGMPKAIYETGIVDEVVALDSIAETITKRVGVR